MSAASGGVHRASVMLLLSAIVHAARAQTPSPAVPHPLRPTPAWSWDRLSLAFHGANKTGMFTEQAVKQLANYRMVTVSFCLHIRHILHHLV